MVENKLCVFIKYSVQNMNFDTFFATFFWYFLVPCNHLSGASHNPTVSTCILSSYGQTFVLDNNWGFLYNYCIFTSIMRPKTWNLKTLDQNLRPFTWQLISLQNILYPYLLVWVTGTRVYKAFQMMIAFQIIMILSIKVVCLLYKIN